MPRLRNTLLPHLDAQGAQVQSRFRESLYWEGGLYKSVGASQDDFALTALSDSQRRDLLEICDDRFNLRSTVLTSQLPAASWHAQMSDPTMADSILDRLVHVAHSFALEGESLRKAQAAQRLQQERQPEQAA